MVDWLIRNYGKTQRSDIMFEEYQMLYDEALIKKGLVENTDFFCREAGKLTQVQLESAGELAEISKNKVQTNLFTPSVIPSALWNFNQIRVSLNILDNKPDFLHFISNAVLIFRIIDKDILDTPLNLFDRTKKVLKLPLKKAITLNPYETFYVRLRVPLGFILEDHLTIKIGLEGIRRRPS